MLVSSMMPALPVLLFATWFSSVLLPQEGSFFVTASGNDKNNQELPVPTYSSSSDDVPLTTTTTNKGEEGLEKFNYEEPVVAVGTMTIHERVDAAEQFYQEFKRAVEELSRVDVGDFPELKELLEGSLEAIEGMEQPISDSIHFLRLTAAADSSKQHGDDRVDRKEDLMKNQEKGKEYLLSSLEDRTTRSSQGRRELLSPSRVSGKENGGGYDEANIAGVRGNSENKMKSTDSKRNLHNSDYSKKKSDPFVSIHDDLSKNGGDHKKHVKKFIKALQGEDPTTDQAFLDFLNQPQESNNENGGDNDADSLGSHQRRLKTKNEKCQQLAECASQMSLFDLFVLFHADDIDPVTGDVDENVVLFDEIDIDAKKARINSLASQILQQGETILCDDLLEEFHRTVEFDGIPQWEGSTISEVCLAEGTTTFVNLASLYEALVPDVFPEDAVLEKLWDNLDTAIQKFMLGGGTSLQLATIRSSETALLDAISLPTRKQAFDLANRLADETLTCAEELFASSDRAGDPIFEDESLVFSRPSLAFMSPSYGGGGEAFDDSNLSNTFYRIRSITVYSHGNVVNGIRVHYRTPSGSLQTFRQHGVLAGNLAVASFVNAPLVQIDLRTSTRVNQITFTDANGVVSGPFGGSGGVQQPPIRAGPYQDIFALYGTDDGNALNSLGVHFLDAIPFDDYFTPRALAYQVPNGLFTGGDGRSPHGQVTSGGSDLFTFTSTTTLLREYGSCLNQVIGPITGLVQVFENARSDVSRARGFVPCDNDPQNTGFICSELNAVGLWPVEDQNPFMCGSDGWVSYDGTFCCSAALCSRLQCGNLCPDESNSFLALVADKVTRAKCCEEDIRRNAFECSDSKHVGCKIKEGNRWYDIAIRQAREKFLEETESEKTCASDYFNALQHGLGLVFGQRRSTPGYVCGIKSAVVDENKSLPGTCCLDAPYELNDEDWGSDYKCSMTCQNLGPYFSGMSEETCDVYGGTWCPQPTDCSTLQTCMADLLVTAQSESRLQAFAMYLGAAPNITDPMDYEQCGETREYFGFDPDFINDAQICDDIEQLRFSRDFTFLEEFLGQGSGMAPSGSPPGTPANTPPGVDGEPEDVPPLELTPPDRSATGSTPVQNGQGWRSTNFALDNQVVKGKTLLRLTADVSCLLDFKFIKANICLKVRNVLVGKQSAVVKLADLVLAISEFTYGELGEIDNVGQLAILENSDAIFGNMELMATYLQERFMALNGYIENETDDIRTNMILDTGFLDGRIQLLLDHFNIPSDTRRNRRLEGRKAGSDDEAIDGRQQKQNQEKDTYVAGGKKDHDVHDPEEEGQDRRSVSPLLHKVQIEITSFTHPRSFVCSVLRHDDAGVSPKLLMLEMLDIATRTRVPVALYEVDNLGKGAILVTITPGIDGEVYGEPSIDGASTAVTYFATVGLTEDGSSEDAVVAKHSLVVSFPPASVARL